MAVKMRLTRLGDKKSPFYRIVVADSRVARDAKYIDLIGTYNPLTNPEEVKIDAEKAKTWINNGAQPTATVKALFTKAGVSAKAEKKAKAEKPAKAAKAPKAEKSAEKPAAKKTTTKAAASKTTTTKAKSTKSEEVAE